MKHASLKHKTGNKALKYKLKAKIPNSLKNNANLMIKKVWLSSVILNKRTSNKKFGNKIVEEG